MTTKQYNNVIDYTIKHNEAEDTLVTTRAICENMGIPLPQGDLATVSETLKSNEYMGWRSCTMQEAQEAADNGTAAIAISEDGVAIIAANDEEAPIADSTAVMTLTKNGDSLAMSSVQYYSNSQDKYYAMQVVNAANRYLGMTETQVENASNTSLANGAWCVDFVRLCCRNAGVYHGGVNIPTTSSSTEMRNWFRSNFPDRFYTGPAGIKAGDIAFIKESSSSTNPYHTCIATSGVKSNGKVATINGNWGGKVSMQDFPYSGGQIGWYVRPKYY